MEKMSEETRKYNQDFPPKEAEVHVGRSESATLPGDAPGLESRIMDMGMSALQKFTPVNQIHQHLCAFHFYAHDMTRQVEAHHYCSHLTEDFRQCVIYDSEASNARLIGVEYVISERIFQSLSEEEKMYWHSHNYEVLSGTLLAPRVPKMVEVAEMEKLAHTYGKTWHFWQVDKGDPLPFGPPTLMMAITDDGQVNPELLKERDIRYGIDSKELRKYRESRIDYSAQAGADHWKHDDQAWQAIMVKTPMKKMATVSNC